MALKQVILVRDDLKLPKGKLAAQCAHAAVDAAFKSDKERVKEWRNQGMAKIVLKVADLKELYFYNDQAKALGFVTSVIEDAGKTVVEPGTVTCLAIGPDKEDKIDKLTGKLKMV